MPATPDQPLESDDQEEISVPTPAALDQADTAPEEMIHFDKPDPQAILAEDDNADRTQVTINEKNAQIWYELGNIYYNTGAFDEAMHAFEMALELDPSLGWSYNNLASIYFQKKRYAEAIPLYQKGLQLMENIKDKALLWNRMGDAFRRLNEHNQAAAAYRKAKELDPDNGLLSRARTSLLANHRA
jgi:tetratricopeptide (TPR) repeat protein